MGTGIRLQRLKKRSHTADLVAATCGWSDGACGGHLRGPRSLARSERLGGFFQIAPPDLDGAVSCSRQMPSARRQSATSQKKWPTCKSMPCSFYALLTFGSLNGPLQQVFVYLELNQASSWPGRSHPLTAPRFRVTHDARQDQEPSFAETTSRRHTDCPQTAHTSPNLSNCWPGLESTPHPAASVLPASPVRVSLWPVCSSLLISMTGVILRLLVLFQTASFIVPKSVCPCPPVYFDFHPRQLSKS
ncbi:hypothetical protein V8F33_008829 [Rhypophila sp. PSN 637]